MQRLVQGVARFQREIFGHHRELFERLAQAQAPEALFVTCADSRINPLLLTQSEPGDLFILRNAGNLVPPRGHWGGEAATVEFAVAVLGVRDIVVCGHSDCGAMKALHRPPPDELPAVRRWLEHAEPTRRRVRERYAGLTGRRLLDVTVQENVLAQLDNLRTHAPVAARLADGRLRLHAWVYRIETGEVFSFDPGRGQFRSLTAGVRPEAGPAAGEARPAPGGADAGAPEPP